MSFVESTAISFIAAEHELHIRRPSPSQRLVLKSMHTGNRFISDPQSTLLRSRSRSSHIAVPPLSLASFIGASASMPLMPHVFHKLKSHTTSLLHEYWEDLPAVAQEVLYDLGYRNPLLESQERHERERCFPPPPSTVLRTRRLEPATQELHTAWGWPSGGGLLVKTVDNVELKFLGLDRDSRNSPSLDPTDEDAFCLRLRKLGAQFFASENDYQRASVPDLGYDTISGDRATCFAAELQVGWPVQGGVWVLEVANKQLQPKDLFELHAAQDMEERCTILKGLGAAFISDPQECKYMSAIT